MIREKHKNNVESTETNLNLILSYFVYNHFVYIKVCSDQNVGFRIWFGKKILFKTLKFFNLKIFKTKLDDFHVKIKFKDDLLYPRTKFSLLYSKY